MNNCTFLRDNCISVNDKMRRPVLRVGADTISRDIGGSSSWVLRTFI